MICASRTDGSVTAGGNTLIVRNLMLTFLSLFAFSPSDISPGNWERPISGHRSVLNLRPRCPWGCREVSEPLPDSWLPDKLKNLLVWPGWGFFLFCFFLLDRFCVWSAIVYLSSRLCTSNQNGILRLLVLLVDVTSPHLRLAQAGKNSKSAEADEAPHVSFIASPHQMQPNKDSQSQFHYYRPRFLSFWSSWEACLQFQSTGVFVRYK